MRDTTKRKIANCVKKLMTKKDIRKITIQDVMDETKMSRQCFYYHFRDIYDVVEWIIEHDFTEKISCEKSQSIEDWAVCVSHVQKEERAFFERIVNQMEWPKLVAMIREPIEKQMRNILRSNRLVSLDHNAFEFCIKFAADSYCYRLLDDAYRRKYKTDEEVRMEINGLFLMVSSQSVVCQMDTSKFRQKIAV